MVSVLSNTGQYWAERDTAGHNTGQRWKILVRKILLAGHSTKVPFYSGRNLPTLLTVSIHDWDEEEDEEKKNDVSQVE